jgi:hypothetical protein
VPERGTQLVRAMAYLYKPSQLRVREAIF